MQKAKERRDARHVENRMGNERGSAVRTNPLDSSDSFYFSSPMLESNVLSPTDYTCVHGKMCEIRPFYFSAF
jgi:hypothetical protein